VGDRVEGTRTWSYVLVPLAAGDRTIAPVRFAYFDPAARAYKELSGPPLRIRVSRGSAIAGGAEAGGVRREVVAMRRDIRFIKPAGRLGKGAERFRGGALFWLLVVLPLAANAALYAHLRRKEHLSANVGLFRFRRASRAARQRLRRARRSPRRGTTWPSTPRWTRAITGYVADKFGVAGAGLTRERILEMLAEKGVAADLRDAAISCLEQCDFAASPRAARREAGCRRWCGRPRISSPGSRGPLARGRLLAAALLAALASSGCGGGGGEAHSRDSPRGTRRTSAAPTTRPRRSTGS